MLGEIVNNMKQISAIYDINEAKTNAYYEAAINEYIINCKTAQLKVFQESGTEDDLLYLEAEAGKSFFDKIVDTLQGILNNILTFFKNLFEKITGLFKKNSEKIDKLEKIAKSNPAIGNAKIDLPDNKALNDNYNKAMAELDKLEAKMKAGKEISEDELDNIEKNFFERHRKILTGAGVVAGTVVAGIALYKKLATSDTLKGDNFVVNNLNKLITWCNSKREKNIDKAIAKDTGVRNLPSFMYAPKIAMLRNSIARAKSQGLVYQMQGLLTILKTYTGKGISDTEYSDIHLSSKLRPFDDPHSDRVASDMAKINNGSDVSVVKNMAASMESYTDYDDSINNYDNIDDDSSSDITDYDNNLNEGYSDKFSEIINKLCTDGLSDRNKFTELQNKIYNNLNTSDLVDDNNDDSFFR